MTDTPSDAMSIERSEADGLLEELVRDILRGSAGPDPAGDEWHDLGAFKSLADAGVLAAAVPESQGGDGLELVELFGALHAVGDTATRAPILSALTLGVLPLSKFGGEHTAALLSSAIAGTALVTTALVDGSSTDFQALGTTAIPKDDGWVLNGTKARVVAGTLASAIIVPALTSTNETILAIVDPTVPGVRTTVQHTASDEPEAILELMDVEVGADDVLVGPDDGADALKWMRDLATVSTCVALCGVASAAVALTVAHTVQREQFGRALARFQSVTLRVADAHIAVDACRLSALRALWCLSSGLPAEEEILIARYLAGEAGDAAVVMSHRLHGGVGVDLTHPLTALTLQSRHWQFSLGSASRALSDLGDLIAADAVAGTTDEEPAGRR